MRNYYIILVLFTSILTSCSSNNEENSLSPKLNITFVMDVNAPRLDNLGNPVDIAMGNAAQNPDFEILGLHFIGLYKDKFTPYQNGATVFSSPTTEKGGEKAIDFKQELFISPTNNTVSYNLNDIPSGSYEYFRTSIGYQKYNINYNLAGAAANLPNWPTGINDNIDISATLASFLGYNTYLETYDIQTKTITVNANKTQGYFGLESYGNISGVAINEVTEGETPQTTVPNPIDSTSPIPSGSCVVTGKFPSTLIVPENPTSDINIKVIISINKSFEWEDLNSNNKYEPFLGEKVVDMGTRGLFLEIE